jgi:DNA-binding CsgD family transcriptional regulator
MARINASDRSTFLAVKDLCYRGLDSAALRLRAGQLLARHLRVASFCFPALDPGTGLPVHSVSEGLVTEAVEALHRVLLTTPTADPGRWASGERRVAPIEDLVTPDQLRTDPYVTDVLLASDLHYEAQISCASGGRTWGHLCLRRRLVDGPFVRHELRLLAALAPHLTAGLRAAAARVALASSPGSSTGVVVLGPGGEVELVNGAAERLFARPSPGTSHCYSSAVEIVAGMLARSFEDAGWAVVPALTVTDPANAEVYWLRAERVTGSDGRVRGLLLIEPARPPDHTEPLVVMGLSAREAEVALAIVRGQTAVQVATELGISAHTVQDHVRRVYEKLDVHSRQELAARLLGAA